MRYKKTPCVLLATLKMVRVLVVCLMTLVSTLTAQHIGTMTLHDVFLEEFGQTIDEWYHLLLMNYTDEYYKSWDYVSCIFEMADLQDLKDDMTEIIDYFEEINILSALQFSRNLADFSAKSIYDDLNVTCSQYLKTQIQNLTVELSDTMCVKTLLVKTFTSWWKEAINYTQKTWSAGCVQDEWHICSTEILPCTLALQKRIASQQSSFFVEYYDVVPLAGGTPLHIMKEYLVNSTQLMLFPFSNAFSFLPFMAYFLISSPSIHEYKFNYSLPLTINKVLPTSLFQTDNFAMSHDKFTWGIVRSNTGTFKHPCFSYRDIYSRNSSQFLEYLFCCSSLSIIRYTMDLMRCADRNTTLRPLSWTTDTSVYLNSQCLCVAFNGHECGVKAPPGVDHRHYCLYVLLRDFQRQVSYRPAVTYLDYALHTRFSVCKFSNLLSVSFSRICHDTAKNNLFYTILSVQCFFKGLVNKELNCTRTLLANTLNLTELCLAKFFIQLVLCDGDVGDEVRVPYYAAGNSLLVHCLTYLDVVVRVITLVTYLACPQLRNLPGKLLIAYLMTALLRLVLVRATAEDLPLSAHLDVTMDLASTLWLTAYNHFLTSSIKTLRLPHSLTGEETRQVLLRYALLGWVLPAALSTGFFCMDKFLVSRVQFGQLLFVLCNYAALLANLYMFHFNFKFYYDVKSEAELLRRGVRARGLYAILFTFALKTSLVSGAGIIFRLVFTQIQGLEHLLAYFHALGTLQGLLLFLLYGCNSEARIFWLSVGSATLRRFRRRQNSSLRRDSMEMAPIPSV